MDKWTLQEMFALHKTKKKIREYFQCIHQHFYVCPNGGNNTHYGGVETNAKTRVFRRFCLRLNHGCCVRLYIVQSFLFWASRSLFVCVRVQVNACDSVQCSAVLLFLEIQTKQCQSGICKTILRSSKIVSHFFHLQLRCRRPTGHRPL